MKKNNLKMLKIKSKEYAPHMLIGLACVGFGASVYMIYKKTDDVIAAIDTLEDEEINLEERKEALLDLTKAVAPSAILFTSSVTAILYAFNILDNRLDGLKTALTISSAENLYIYNRLTEEKGEEALSVSKGINYKCKIDNKGREIVNSETAEYLFDLESLKEVYWNKSEHFENNPEVDKLRIENIIDEAHRRIFNKQYLTMNEFFDLLGLERTRYGSTLGWTFDAFDPSYNIVYNQKVSDDNVMYIINWTQPKYIYNYISY